MRVALVTLQVTMVAALSVATPVLAMPLVEWVFAPLIGVPQTRLGASSVWLLSVLIGGLPLFVAVRVFFRSWPR